MLIRKSIRIQKSTQDQLNQLMKTGEWVMESELLRKALNIGVNELRIKYGQLDFKH